MARVIHVTSDHGARDSRIFHKECRSLAAAGYDVHLFVRNPPLDADEPGIAFHATFAEPRQRPPSLRSLPWLYAGVMARLLRVGPGVLHIQEPQLIPAALVWKLLRRGRIVYDAHEDYPVQAITQRGASWRGRLLSLVWRALEALARRVCDGVVCATPHIARRFPGERSVTVCNYPRLEQFAAASRSAGVPPDGAFRLCYAGGINGVRGIREMLEAVQRVAATHPVRLILLGQLQNTALNDDVLMQRGWQHVQYLGMRQAGEVAEILATCQAGLVPLHPAENYLESLPVKLFEYMAAGIPVIASNFPLWRSIVEGAGAGLTVDPLDSDAVAGAVRYLIEHPAEAAAMGAAGRKAVEAHYNWAGEERTLLGLYQRLAPR